MGVSLIGVPATDKPLFFIDGKEADSPAAGILSLELVKNMAATVGKKPSLSMGEGRNGEQSLFPFYAVRAFPEYRRESPFPVRDGTSVSLRRA